MTRSKPGPPMTLANMRQNGVRAVSATCEGCGHKADVNVDALPETVTPKGRPAPTVLLLRRQARLDQARMAHRPTPGRARLSTRVAPRFFRPAGLKPTRKNR